MDKIKEIIVKSLGELIDAVTPSKQNKISGRLRDIAIYRGLADKSTELLTSLDRLGGIYPPHTKRNTEKHILRNFLRYSRPYIGSIQNHWEALIQAQHHGLPTRLLDWTYSPMVAAHFATLEEDQSMDCVVWKLDWIAMHRHFGLQEEAFLVEDLSKNLKIKSVWSLFDDSKINPFICMLEPPSLNARIVAQSATFTLASTTEKSFNRLIIESELESCLTRFIIPNTSVDLIRDQLDMCCVDERRLFPDLDGISKEMKRYYSSSACKNDR